MIAPRKHAIVYGPIKYGSPKKDRLGTSLIVDPMPMEDPPDGDDAPFGRQPLQLPSPIWTIHSGNRPPSAGVIITSAARRIIELSKAGDKLDNIIVQGLQDPTKHPNFKAIVENLRELRNKWFSKAKLTLFTSPMHLEDPQVRHAVALFDQPIIRFEWGTAKTFASMTGASSRQLKSVMENLASVDRFIVEAVFRKDDNSGASEVRGWLKRVEELRPLEVQLTTVGTTRKRGGPKPVPASFLEGLAEEIREKTGLPAQVFDDGACVA